MMEAVLSNADHPEYGVATIPLPIPRNQYDHCVALLEALEIGDASEADCRLDSLDSAWPVLNRLSGGLMLGAWFMATDYTTSPVTHGGQIAYGVGCGVLTFLFRYFGSYVEGVSYAILIMNCCVGFFDRIGVPKRFGAVRQKKQKKGGAEA